MEFPNDDPSPDMAPYEGLPPDPPDDTPGEGNPEKEFVIDTIPTHYVREGFPETDDPYGRVVGVTTDEYVSGIHPDVYSTDPVPVVSHHEVSMDSGMVDNFAEYYSTFHADGPEDSFETNCARFACEVIGIELGEERPWIQAFVPLAEAVSSENEWDPAIPLPSGAVGVLATYELKPGTRGAPSPVTHACIGTGTPYVLQVTALGGYLGLRDQEEMVAHMRRETTLDGFAAEDLRLFVLPRRTPDTPAEE
jgi:hypothetical protein